MAKILLIEPFYTGSHKQLIDVLNKQGTDLVTLPGKKWQWKARTSALWFSQIISRNHNYRTLFASSVLNLAELIALRPDLSQLHKVLYFHENQLAYPVRKQQDRDFQFGYNQILSSITADVILFNSCYNMESFLSNISTHLKLIPDHRPKNIADQIRPKCHVLYFPIIFPPRKDTGSKTNLTQSSCTRDMEAEASCNKDSKNETDLLECAETRNLETNDEHMCSYGNERITSIHEANHKEATNMNNQNSNSSGDLNSVNEGSVDSENKKSVTENKELTGSCTGFTSGEQIGSAKSANSDVVKAVGCVITTSDTSLVSGRTCVADTALFNMGPDSVNTDETVEIPNKKLRIDKVDKPLHIVWPHRWEHDKDPEMFFRVMLQLKESGAKFRLSVLGETFTDVPDIFEESRVKLSDEIDHWGFQASKEDYYNILREADCVVSSALHEFFGVAMLEAVHLGCYPLCPNRLVYPEIFPKEFLYNTEQQLFKKLREFCRKPHIIRSKERVVNTDQFSWDALKDQFEKFLKCEP